MERHLGVFYPLRVFVTGYVILGFVGLARCEQPLTFAGSSSSDFRRSDASAPYYVARATRTQPRPDAGSYDELLAVNAKVAREAGETGAPLLEGWWDPLVWQPLRSEANPLSLSLEEVLWRTLSHSTQIKVFGELPMIRETAIGEANARFDPHVFVDTRWDDLSDPVGSTLTTGGDSRYHDHHYTFSAGTRKKTRAGGQVEVAQQLGFQDTNSLYFVPAQQGASRLTLSFTQPLLRGHGRVYNESLTVLAQIDKRVADEEFRRQLEAHLLEVTRSYWALHMERALLYQKLNSFRRAEQIASKLEIRREIDASGSQLVSARASMTQRQADLFRARQGVKNAEARLRALINDPQLARFEQIEIIPIDSPVSSHVSADMHESFVEAMQSRPEIAQVLKQIKAASIRLDMAKHELLPQLNLVTEAYVAGLEGGGRADSAWMRQFDSGQPGYSVGLQFEVPLGKRAEACRKRRRGHELRQLRNQYATVLETVRLEVEVAVRELETSLREIVAKQRAMQARQLQLDSLTRRWNQLPGEGVSASLALENLLLAQDRLAEAEQEFLQARLTYSLGQTNLRKATGTLLEHEEVHIGRACENCLPTHVLDKPILERPPIVTRSESSGAALPSAPMPEDLYRPR